MNYFFCSNCSKSYLVYLFKKNTHTHFNITAFEFKKKSIEVKVSKTPQTTEQSTKLCNPLHRYFQYCKPIQWLAASLIHKIYPIESVINKKKRKN